MESIRKLKTPPPTEVPPDTQAAAPSLHEFLTMQAETDNAREGSLTGYACEICRNKGYTMQVRDTEIVAVECSCIKVRRTLRHIHESGLEKLLRRCKFSNFEVSAPWQEAMKSAAVNFSRSDAPGIFYGGQTGCGKTHLCTAIVGHCIKQGQSARYFVWRDDAPVLKALVNEPEYADRMRIYKQTDCLYIDDLFKDGVTDADKRLAFELIDYRYRNGLRTLISTEMTEQELVCTDEALAGRIFQMAKGFRMVIPKDPKKNYRLR